MNIIDIRKTESGWVADGYIGGILPVSKPVNKVHENDLIRFANTDPAHVAKAQTLSRWNSLAAQFAPKPHKLVAFIDCTHPREHPTMNGIHCNDCGTTRDPIGKFEKSLVSKLTPRGSGYVNYI